VPERESLGGGGGAKRGAFPFLSAIGANLHLAFSLLFGTANDGALRGLREDA